MQFVLSRSAGGIHHGVARLREDQRVHVEQLGVAPRHRPRAHFLLRALVQVHNDAQKGACRTLPHTVDCASFIPQAGAMQCLHGAAMPPRCAPCQTACRQRSIAALPTHRADAWWGYRKGSQGARTAAATPCCPSHSVNGIARQTLLQGHVHCHTARQCLGHSGIGRGALAPGLYWAGQTVRGRCAWSCWSHLAGCEPPGIGLSVSRFANNRRVVRAERPARPPSAAHGASSSGRAQVTRLGVG